MTGKNDSEDDSSPPTNEEIMERLEEISHDVHKFTLADYIKFIKSPRKMVLINFISGLARGLGIAVGITFLGAIFLLILIRMAEANIPVIGEFLARLIQVIQNHL
ncbi:DUF5665 domain-containing protein [Halarsenatibacter silvermanii]|uniref:Uncharacterized protein n=1 Tax=Halarsenatibacter silvermanii TaxID=321763 RepID=A0A1G9JKL0_9FIRM|nr:DUF5665 domain-containing protein [Halarsenatibacter silvermanii]SDL38127.1 hypothetical protein SAMN04488692_10424 [Halarsenatibacter silvermanii]